MAASLRSQRVLQRLATSTPGPRRPFLTNSRNTPTRDSCVLCQHRLTSTTTTAAGVSLSSPVQQTRSFTSTPRPSSNTRSNSNNTTTSPTESPPTTLPNTPNTTTHYTIFPQTLPAGPPPNAPFSIPLAALRREFLQLQNTLHPDKYPPGAQKTTAEALSARINDAYRTLSDPLLRAQYLLREMHGIDVTAEDGAAQHPLDPELLMEVMDVQETIEEVSGDPGAEGKIAELKRENDGRIEGVVRALGEAFDRGDVEAARHECVRLKFWYSVAQGLREWEPGMEQIRLVH